MRLFKKLLNQAIMIVGEWSFITRGQVLVVLHDQRYSYKKDFNYFTSFIKSGITPPIGEFTISKLMYVSPQQLEIKPFFISFFEVLGPFCIVQTGSLSHHFSYCPAAQVLATPLLRFWTYYI